MTDPIVKILTVPLSPKRAYKLFTEEMADWWPLEQHSISQDGTATIHVPDRVGEQVIEEKPDGTTTPWGRVTESAPGEAFGMTWHVGRPESDATHVRVTFDVVADGTKVTLVHDGWHAMGNEAKALRQNYFKGWEFVFSQCFGGAANKCAPLLCGVV